MPPSPSRATISSLKAAKTAHRMASEIQNPHVGLPQPPQPALEFVPPVPREIPDLPAVHLKVPPIEWPRPPFEWVYEEDESDANAAAGRSLPRQSPIPRMKLTLEQRLTTIGERWLAVAVIVLAIAITICGLQYVMTHL